MEQENDRNNRNTQKVLDVIGYSKSKNVSYNANQYQSGYHSIKLGGQYFRGQRECDLRLKDVPYDFSGKTVLDIGCNIGGMLYAVSDKIKCGVGIDNDRNFINAANLIKSFNGNQNLQFYMFDIQKDPLEALDNFILFGEIDIILLLSVCMWIDNSEDVIRYCSNNSKHLLFETNGSDLQQSGQISLLNKYYPRTSHLSDYSLDDRGQINRKLYFCEK